MMGTVNPLDYISLVGAGMSQLGGGLSNQYTTAISGTSSVTIPYVQQMAQQLQSANYAAAQQMQQSINTPVFNPAQGYTITPEPMVPKDPWDEAIEKAARMMKA
jgi:dihydrodipicolinate synthase/N-acetylneuraminate lyase